ncbi:hypothetical protein [Streptomyces sp. G-5]|uniref:hypothetical protein n=1 Tax=Streptomyces sp. G-5 TaxID=2977231 RepID=UPI0021CF1246|nr:hypothetical protein [Streptomyces sp. G-5]MCU4750288.1 hypothetical protein [Streptomyces sp. G-5]
MASMTFDYPASLQLQRRGQYLKADSGMSLKDQLTQAWDEFLTRRGYPLKPTNNEEGGDPET